MCCSNLHFLQNSPLHAGFMQVNTFAVGSVIILGLWHFGQSSTIILPAASISSIFLWSFVFSTSSLVGIS